MQTIVNLSEATGKEASVTIGYRDVVKDLDDPDVRYNEFDFHRECQYPVGWHLSYRCTESLKHV